MIKRIMLDLDGVIADFDAGVCRLFDIPYFKSTGWNGLIDHVCRVRNLTKNDFWRCLDYKFWSSLPFTPEGEEVLALVAKTGLQVTIVTSPSIGGCDGKQAWISEFLPDYFVGRRYLIGPAKDACAGPGNLLIDDSEDNCRKFRAAGGQALLFPRTWNTNARFAESAVSYLRWSLESLRVL